MELTYILAWESLAEREQKWTTFQADPEWIAAAEASPRTTDRSSRNVVNQFLKPTSFSSR